MDLRVWISLGSNQGNRLLFLRKARESLGKISQREIKASSIYETAAWGGVAQGAFLNQVVGFILDPTALNLNLTAYIEEHSQSSSLFKIQYIDPRVAHIRGLNFRLEQILESLMLYLLMIEVEQERDRSETAVRWGSRTLDLDFLYFEILNQTQTNLIKQDQYKSLYLELPHPLLSERQFVLTPWNEVAPSLYLSYIQSTIQELKDLAPSDDSLSVYFESSETS